MFRDIMPRPRTVVATALLLGAATLTLRNQCEAGAHFCNQPIVSDTGQYQWPFGADLTNGQAALIAKAKQAAIDATQHFSSGGVFGNPSPITGESASTLPAAPLSSVQKAASLIINGPNLLCPTETKDQYDIVQGKSSTALCIDAKSLKLLSNGTIIAAPRLNPKTGQIIDLPAALNKPENKLQCFGVTSILSAFTQSEFHVVGLVPPTESVAVQIVGDMVTPGMGQCDSYKPGSAAAADHNSFIPIG